MLAKHPQELDEVPIPDCLPDAFFASAEDCVRALASFKRISAPGPDGIRVVWLQDALKGTYASSFAACLERFCNFALSGRIIEDVRAFFFGADLFAGPHSFLSRRWILGW